MKELIYLVKSLQQARSETPLSEAKILSLHTRIAQSCLGLFGNAEEGDDLFVVSGHVEGDAGGGQAGLLFAQSDAEAQRAFVANYLPPESMECDKPVEGEHYHITCLNIAFKVA